MDTAVEIVDVHADTSQSESPGPPSPPEPLPPRR